MRTFAFAFAAVVWSAAAPSAGQGIPPAEAYGRLPAISDVAISPNGERIAVATFDGAQSAMRIVNLSSNTVEAVSSAPAQTKLRWVGWADDDYALFYVSQTFRPGEVGAPTFARYRGPGLIEYWRVGIYSLSNRTHRYVQVSDRFNWAHVGLANLQAPIEGDPGSGRMISWGQLRSPRLSVYRIDLDSGEGRPTSIGAPDTIDFVLDERGEIVARLDSDEDSNRWSIHAGNGARRELLLEGVHEYGAPPNVVGLLQDGRLAIADRMGEDIRDRFYAVNFATRELEALTEDDTFDIDGAIHDPWTHRVVGAAWTGDFPRQHFFDEGLREVAARLQAHFTDTYVRVMNWSRDRRRFVVFAETNRDAGIYYVYEPASNTLRPIGQAYPELTDVAALGSRQAISYRARDGVRVPAYLTTPAGVEARNLPLVLLVHGGPHARDTFTFDWWASFLASRGYAVLQPNYRGSTGYGHAWFDAGRGGWGDGVMQHDVEDGVDALVRAGIADGRRVCIVGASYGGYAALAGATLTPDRYQCAVAIAGVSDVLLMLSETERYTGRDSMSSDWWRLSIGDRRADRDHLFSISPANRASDVRAPILLMHGADDTVVPLAQSRLMARRLAEAGREHQLIVMEGDDHWLSTAPTRTRMLRELEVFLAQHIGAASTD